MGLEILKSIGLSRGEVVVYEALLETGPSTLNKIHERIGIERRNIYDIINKLIGRGFVSYIIENKKRVFQVSHPVQILKYIDEKKHELDTTRKEIEREIETILQKYNLKRPQVNAEIYRGTDGMKAVWMDMLNYREILWIGSGRYMPKLYPNFFEAWNRRRIKLKIKVFNILRKELKREIKKPYPLEYVRFLPGEFSGNPAVVGIYGNKVINLLFVKEPLAFVIESKEIAENYRLYHKFLWNSIAKK